MAVSPRRSAPGQPGASLLTGAQVRHILAAALTEAGGGAVLSWRAHQVDHQPQRGSTAAYQAQVRWADGRVTSERFGVYTGTAPAGAFTVGNGTEQVAVWRFPQDPYLPALAKAYDPAAVGELLRSFGLGDGPARLRLRAYRARRRAVVEAVGTAGRLFLKVVRPARAAALHQRHRLFTAAGVPAARSLGHSPDGLLVLQALPGQTLRQALRAEPGPLPSAGAVLALLDRLPAELAEGPARRSWLDRAEHYASVVAEVLPEHAERARQLGAAITAEGTAGPTVPVHGDLYENQLLIDQGRITGLLDIDTAGPGDRLDDLACLLGHLSVLTQLDPRRAAAIGQLGARYLAAFERVVSPVDLRYRVAAVVLSLATGPYRVQEHGWYRSTRSRLELAERWLASARSLAAEGSLTRRSGLPHQRVRR